MSKIFAIVYFLEHYFLSFFFFMFRILPISLSAIETEMASNMAAKTLSDSAHKIDMKYLVCAVIIW